MLQACREHAGSVHVRHLLLLLLLCSTVVYITVQCDLHCVADHSSLSRDGLEAEQCIL